MSIRQFAIIPCATCGRDTVHYVLKCQECGTIQPTPAQIRVAATRRILNSNGRFAYIKAKRLHTRELRRQRTAVPEGSLESRK